MRIVTFQDIVPGMVLHPVDYVTPEGGIREPVLFGGYLVILGKSEYSDFFGGRSLHFISTRDVVSEGGVHSPYRTDDRFMWAVIDDQSELDKVRALVKKEINSTRDTLDDVERFVDENL